jgi:RHS repeat-associated protein
LGVNPLLDAGRRRVYIALNYLTLIAAAGTAIYAGACPERSQGDGDNQVEQLDASGTPTERFTQGLGIDEPLAVYSSGKWYFYQADGLGSIVAFTSANAGVQAYYTYDSFGNTSPLNNVPQPYYFTGRELDTESGLYYYRARYYDPTVGRFLSEDPMGFTGLDVNLYRYVYNSPVSYSDPPGMGALGAAIGGAIGALAGGYVGAGLGAGAGAGVGALAGAPAAPVEVVTIPVGTGAGGLAGAIGGVILGGSAGAVIGSRLEDLILQMARGGKQNISNEIVDQAKAAFGNNRDAICRWLDSLYQKAGPAMRLKIKLAQKYFGCRRCGGGS